MALQVWLPLNGNLDNQGLANVYVTNNGATVNTAGKIGSCYQFGSAASSLSCPVDFVKSMTGGVSFAFWVKLTDWGSNYSTIFDINTGYYSWHQEIFAFQKNGSNHTMVFNIADGVSSHTNTSCETRNLELNTWYHFTAVYSPGQIRIYQNGTLVDSDDTSVVPGVAKAVNFVIGAASTGGGYQLNGCLNDFRVYDHALSPREVAEIAKGLVLHYPLNDSYIEPTTNLCTTQAGGWNNSGTCVRNTDDTSILNKPTPGPVYSLTATSDGSMAISLGNTTANLPSKTLVASVYCWLDGTQDSQVVYLRSQSSDGSVGNLMYNGDLNPLTWPKKRWIRLVSSPITTASNATKFYICTYVNKNTEVRAFNGWQIEENSHVTDWVAPGTTRAASTTVYDTSGFGNNGTSNGTFTVSSNTARYDVSTVFNGVDNSIKIPFNAMLGTSPTDYTVSVWTYKTVIGTKNYQTILGGPSGFELEARSSSSTSPLYRIHSWGGGTTPYNFNEWTLFTFVRTASDSKLYVNGQLKITGTTGIVPTGNYFIGSWSTATSQNFEGQMSDFRIYATALTADQVKQLYEAPISLANNGTLFANEFNET